MGFTVIKVIDGDTFEVSPHWNWSNQTGRGVIAMGYNAPKQNEPGYQSAKDKITDLILNKEIELTRPVKLTCGMLLCVVEYNGTNLADYFPEYK
jgi:endonuclease YncB( thermonuclease family)